MSIRVLAIAAAMVLSSGAAWAGDYPTGPITVIVPYTAGGVTDQAARLIAAPLGQRIGAEVLVENAPGASGSIGATKAARAAADGYTLLYGSSGNLALNPLTMKDLPYDPAKDFAPIQATWESPLMLVVHPDRPYKTLEAFIAYAQEHPGEITFSSAGVGSNGHLASEQFQQAVGVELRHVPYQGTAQGIVDLIAGRIDVSFDYGSTAGPYIEAGQLVPLASTGPSRTASYPDLPTMAEAGHPEATTAAWSGFLAPAGTPEPILHRLAEAIQEVLKLPEVVSYYEGNGSIALPDTTGDKFGVYIAEQTETFRSAIERAGITFQ